MSKAISQGEHLVKTIFLGYLKELNEYFNMKNGLTLICRFMVIQKRVIKYITRIGQNTGILNTSKKVRIVALIVETVTACQNLNSGSLRIKGLNSSLDFVGSSGPSESVINYILIIH